MKLEDQVISLELAKKLKELGVDEDSQFYWEKLELKDWEKEAGVFGYCLSYFYDGTPYRADEIYRAYSVAELGGLLNELCSSNFDDSLFQMLGATNGFIIRLADINHTDFPTVDSWTAEFLELNEADARAKMLIYLIENNLITV